MDWAEKYRPARLQDIVGNATAVRQMADWAANWTRASRPLLVYGKPGTGKTSSTYALANDLHWEVIELNASDQRTAAIIERVAGGGSTTASLTGSARKLIVLDEADNLQGNADRGGARAIIECIKNARQPIILIANDLYGLSPELRARCEPVQFKALMARSIVPRLKYICSAEKVGCSDTALREIAESADGDMRSAVNQLYASAIGREAVDGQQVHTSQKDERVSIFTLITALYSKATDEEILRLARDVEDTPENIEQWVEGNLQHLNDPDTIARAYRHLARADEYLGNTYRRQYHTLWRYATALMLLGVADAAAGRGIHARIMPPERWQRMATAKKQKLIRSATQGKVAGIMNLPADTLRERYLDLVTMLVTHDPELYARTWALDADQLNFFLNDRARSQEIVKGILSEERDREKEQKKIKKGKPAEEKAPQEVPPPPPPPPPPPAPEPLQKEEKKQGTQTQSTLFDGF